MSDQDDPDTAYDRRVREFVKLGVELRAFPALPDRTVLRLRIGQLLDSIDIDVELREP